MRDKHWACATRHAGQTLGSRRPPSETNTGFMPPAKRDKHWARAAHQAG
nr:hypothetical protein [uncultured Cardiobacterium sp.]